MFINGVELPASPRMLYEVQRGKCFHCGKFMSPWSYDVGNPMGWTREHVIPKAKNGKDIVLACLKCNGKKGSKTPSEKMVHKKVTLHTLVIETFFS